MKYHTLTPNADPAPPAATPPGGMLSRPQLAARWGLSVRTIDELTRNGVLGHYKIGRAIRYDAAEVDAAMRGLFHVRARACTLKPETTTACEEEASSATHAHPNPQPAA